MPVPDFVFILFFQIIYFWLCWVFIAVCKLSLVVGLGILILGASLVVEHGLQAAWTSGIVAQGL